MSLSLLNEPPPPPSPPCACCSTPSEVEIWGLRMCLDCGSAWHAEPAFQAGVTGLDLDLDAMCAKYRTETERWARARRSNAA